MENPKLVLLDCCLPDYFQGHSNRVLVGYPTNETTIKEVLDDLLDDANNQEITTEFCNYTYDDLDKAYERALKENKEVLDKACFPDLPDIEEDDSDNWEPVVAYFTVIDEV